MKNRCYEPCQRGYHRYGGRGITVCSDWRESYAAFLRDVGRKPSPTHSLDRINPDGNYEPGNVRWATRSEQQNNRSCGLFAIIDGEKMTCTQAARRYGVHKQTLAYHLKLGRDAAEAIRFIKSHRRGSPWPASDQ